MESTTEKMSENQEIEEEKKRTEGVAETIITSETTKTEINATNGEKIKNDKNKQTLEQDKKKDTESSSAMQTPKKELRSRSPYSPDNDGSNLIINYLPDDMTE